MSNLDDINLQIMKNKIGFYDHNLNIFNDKYKGNQTFDIIMSRFKKYMDCINKLLCQVSITTDKHLKELLKYGIVERYWLFDSRKPRLEYKLSSLGIYFYTECDELVDDYRNKGREILNKKLKENDVKLLNNEINVDEYNKNSDNIKKEYEWFI